MAVLGLSSRGRKLLIRWVLPVAIAVAATAGVATTLPAPAEAMTVLAVDLKALVTTADQLLYGRVAAVRTLDLRKQGRGVWTEFDLDVKEVWKGDNRFTGKKFSWRHVGGTTADGLTVAVPGMPTFAVGEETIVVLERHAEGHVVSGGPQGKFSVKLGPQGQRTVIREMPDVHMLARDAASGQLRPAPKQVSLVRSLGEFKAEVLSYVSPAAAKRMPSARLPAPPMPARPPVSK